MPSPRAVIIGIAGPVLTEGEAALLRARPPSGVILFGRNVQDRAQLKALTAALREALPPQAVLMVDQEGGRVARLRPPHWRAHPSAGRIGALFESDPESGLRAAWLTGALVGRDCAEAGFDIACAPVLDLRMQGASDVVGDRSYGADPETVARLGAAVADGLLAAGIQPVIKHLPGHGRAQVDSHLALPEVDDIHPEDLLPFIANRALPWAMTAHLLYRARDPVHPATLSPRIIAEVIRGEIGFDGMLCSDDLAMHALTGSPVSRTLASLAAGCDVALYCAGDAAANLAVLEACPPLMPAALTRLAAARALAQDRANALDAAGPAADLAAERDALLQ